MHFLRFICMPEVTRNTEMIIIMIRIILTSDAEAFIRNRLILEMAFISNWPCFINVFYHIFVRNLHVF